MGLTMRCNEMELTMGYIHFKLLRDKIAEKVGEEYFKLYTEPYETNAWLFVGEKRKAYFDDNAKRQLALNKRLKVPKLFQWFMWACDCEGKCTSRQSAVVLRYAEKIQGDDLNIRLGYVYDEVATVKYFIEMLKESVKTKTAITWN